jgi:hypothetical protein
VLGRWSGYRHTNVVRVSKVSFGPFVDMDVLVLMTRGPFTISPPVREFGIGHDPPVFARKEVNLSMS